VDSGFTHKDVLYIALGAAALYVLYRVVTTGAEDVKKGLNVTSPDNYANRAADALTEKVTGEKGATVGNKLYDFFNPRSPYTIEVFLADGSVKLANGTVLEKGWRVDNAGMLYDKTGKLLGKAG
jgi:hypothetical protein